MLFALLGAALAAPPDIAVAYHGHTLTHPGASATLGWSLVDGRAGAVRAEVAADAWWHPRHQVALTAHAGPTWIWTGRKGRELGLLAHAGVMRGTWTNPTFTVEDGAVERVPLAGRTQALAVVGLHTGRELDGPLDAWFLRPQVGMRFPDLYAPGLDFAVQAGVRWGGAA